MLNILSMIFSTPERPFIFVAILLFFAIPICSIKECKKEVFNEPRDAKKTKNY
jgi:hypothetical protein